MFLETVLLSSSSPTPPNKHACVKSKIPKQTSFVFTVQAFDLQDWLCHIDDNENTFYRALVGDPVDGSQGSLWHNRKSRKQHENASYLKIKMTHDDVESGLAQLSSLGINQLSVTSPLKKAFALGSREGVPKSYGMQILETPDDRIRFANTLSFDGQKWHGLDTDWVGMMSAFEELKEHGITKGTIALYGRGDVSRAVLAAIKATAWEVVYHTGARDGWVDAPASVTLVINMSGREAFEDACRCEAWIDLHYNNTVSHPSALYFSGDTFFEAQANAQREFWLLCDQTGHSSKPH